MRTQTSPFFGRLLAPVVLDFLAIFFVSPALAKRAVPENLSYDLDKLVESNLLPQSRRARLSTAYKFEN